MSWGFALVLMAAVLTGVATVASAVHGQKGRALFFGAFTIFLAWLCRTILKQGGI